MSSLFRRLRRQARHSETAEPGYLFRLECASRADARIDLAKIVRVAHAGGHAIQDLVAFVDVTHPTKTIVHLRTRDNATRHALEMWRSDPRVSFLIPDLLAAVAEHDPPEHLRCFAYGKERGRSLLLTNILQEAAWPTDPV